MNKSLNRSFYRIAILLLLSISMNALLLLNPFGVSTASASSVTSPSTPTVQLSGPASISVNEQVYVNVSLIGAPNDSTVGKFVFTYNQTAFEYIKTTSAKSSLSIVGENSAPGQISVVVTDSAGGLTQPGPVLALAFKAKTAAGLNGITGSVELGLSDGSIIQTQASSMPLQISSMVQGDLNGNHVWDVGDLALLMKYFGIDAQNPNWGFVSSADFNNDGIINIADLAYLGKKIVYDNGQPFQLMEADIMGIQNAMAAGKLTSVQLVQMYLDRIAAYDKQGPTIKSLITINSNAAAIAASLDQERKDTGPRGLLHGIPIIVKDNYDTVDMPTSAGCTCLKDNQTVSDSYMVKKLKDAGAIILAKANLSEFAINTDTNSSLGGQTKNPYVLTQNPGGSSGGTGASIASNFGVAGLGTDTGGSIRIPSSYNSIVGIRPTIGLTSRDGIIPLALSQDVGGPMTRTVADAAIMLDAVSGYDPNDIVTAGSIGKKPTSYTNYLVKDGLKGARIGLVTNTSVIGSNQEVLGLLNKAADSMRAQGAVVTNVYIPNADTIVGYSSLSAYEFKYNLNDYLSNPRLVNPSSVRYHSLTDIVNSQTDFLSSLKSTLTTRNNVAPLDTNQDYKDILLFRTRLTQQSLLRLMADNNLDVLLYPATTTPTSGGNANRLSPFSGFPAISVPAGYVTNGTPIAIELLARPYEEGQLIKIGYSYEQATHNRVAPKSVPALP
ncbi:amidase family protein [Paenibacillus alba]|uniref:Amidase family protein n=1 Tax=Paenibacillus alba TaxID=1197127 RepID=A0ABU6G094_9BACL|nr:amidase family protein [Paenibacillus alba]MEC0227584.1 amidase family protein [Paenibacillus alba]